MCGIPGSQKSSPLYPLPLKDRQQPPEPTTIRPSRRIITPSSQPGHPSHRNPGVPLKSSPLHTHPDTSTRHPSTITPTQSRPGAPRTLSKQILSPLAQPQDAVLAPTMRWRWTPAGTAQRIGCTPRPMRAAACVGEFSVVTRHTLVPSRERCLCGSVGSRLCEAL